uniref:Ubiquitin carboxyl-terminal hydrolase n=2 Tax=Phaeomonas parva TaxID=124430 RepID=A0A7S1TPE2_9STRA|mmetsp:Transcript_10525/g.31695  ORF Transcript_10525/g.31695 Transcript_10525/m.31695 type:complete len:487 (+) Transcript_10525:190-1650(+)|eukprot:CAMPEP_0118885398 /NCGR_PEP_ID=MMETSP1163-20130328/23889_1 /TAXON_ID=124430 /ORGANISM="Phaeomonas parva, Strain CCMP2877" /LENGTH=486 /DNA_ID=CAMNT_0006823411 /DNA_START=117 /DNA_END=1577 /DNA_ORIENTATION=-
MVRVTVKWNKQVFEDVELTLNGPVTAFKETLQGLTGVPMARQKLMCKGGWKGLLKDDADLSGSGITDGKEIKLMGTAEVIAAPTVAATFVEDLSAAEQAAAGQVLPAGFVNLGNTCYMNSTLQCLKAVPELRASLRAVDSGEGAGAGQSTTFAKALARTFETMDVATEAVPPTAFVSVLRAAEPQFAERNQRGYMQQDAQELFGAVYRHVTAASADVADQFGIEVEEEMKNTEDDAEAATTRSDKLNMLVCNIQGGTGNSIKIDHLHEGLKLGMEAEVEKFSEGLQRNAVYKKSLSLKKLPKYLCVQFMRFFWKATPNSRDHPNGVKCKIMRPVSFPEVLDVFPFCASDLQERMKVYRDVEDDGILDGGAAAAEEKKEGEAEAGGEEMEVVDDELKAAMAMSMPPVDAGPGLPDDFKGNYELFGVVTHKGREADAGHYIGWVRQEGDQWLVFDDDHVEEVNTEAILNLKGGGDWHMAYLAFYRARD